MNGLKARAIRKVYGVKHVRLARSDKGATPTELRHVPRIFGHARTWKELV